LNRAVATPTGFWDAFEREEHFLKHRALFDARTAEEYEARAVSFLRGPVAPPVLLDCFDSSGDYLRFNTITHEFAVMAPDGTVISYYKLYGDRWKTALDRFKDKCAR
jgi:pyocin large subunit-like protein